jgi:uncharacterized phage protein (TIGR01671 family)
MNRTIKFRAWDKNKKVMTFGGAFQTLEVDGVNQEWFGMKTPHPDDCELMQYTGLLDLNGKEIYEGDIVSHPSTNMAIEVAHGLTGWIFRTTDGRLIEYSIQFEIIGNIYEHSELLK